MNFYEFYTPSMYSNFNIIKNTLLFNFTLFKIIPYIYYIIYILCIIYFLYIKAAYIIIGF